jgi:hypothetical protein
MAPGHARAQDYAGNYRIVSDGTTAEVPEWGPDCNQRPENHRGATGRQVRVSVDGSNLVIEDRPRMRTDGCWSDNPQVRRVSGSGGNGRWSVRCSTPSADYQQVDGTYTTTAEGDRITLRDRTVYRWQLRGSTCHATLTRSMVLEKIVTAPPPQDAAPVARTPVPDAAARPQARCAVPGPAARLAIVSGARAASAGSRVCYRAQLQDAIGCPAINGATAVVTWSVTRRSGASPAGEGGCVTIAQGTPTGTEFVVAASAGGFEERVTLRVAAASEPREEITEILAEDAGVLEDPTTTAENAVGGVRSGTTPTPGPAPDAGRHRIVALLAALAALALAAAVFVLRRRDTPAPKGARHGGDPAGTDTASSRNTGSDGAPPSAASRAESPREAASAPLPAGAPAKTERREPAPTLAQTMIGTMPSPNERAVPPVLEGRPPPAQAPSAGAEAGRRDARRCPVCSQKFSHEIAFCPEHGVALVASEGPSSGSIAGPSGGAPPSQTTGERSSRCPRCGRVFGPGHVFCGEDGTPLERI